MSLFNNKYRIESARSKSWDYGSNAMYFVTINTHNKIHLFGEIIDVEMDFSSLGIIANEYMNAIPEHHPFAEVDVYTVMPNHIHAIIRINKPQAKITIDDLNKFGPQFGKLGAVIRGYKSGITKYANERKIPFKWQSRFHDHIIRDEEAYIKIYNYIINNPKNWKEDKFY